MRLLHLFDGLMLGSPPKLRSKERFSPWAMAPRMGAIPKLTCRGQTRVKRTAVPGQVERVVGPVLSLERPRPKFHQSYSGFQQIELKVAEQEVESDLGKGWRLLVHGSSL